MRRLLAALLWLAAGCGLNLGNYVPDGGGGSGGSGGIGGFGGSGGGGGNFDGGGDGQPSCVVTISVTTAQPYYAPASIGLLATVSTLGSYTLSWETTMGQLVGDTTQPQIILNAPTPGSYTVTVHVTAPLAGSCSQAVMLNVLDRTQTQLRLRFTPSASNLPRQEIVQSLIGNAQVGGLFTLQPGLAATLQPVGPTGASVAAYVRLTDRSSCLPIETYAPAGMPPTVYLLDDPLDILVVPDGTAIAPALMSALGHELSPSYQLVLADGARVGGTITQAGAGPLASARVELKSASLPSTVASTDATGAFEVRAAPGQSYGVIVVPPAGSTLAQAESASALVAVSAAGVAPVIGFAYDPTTTHRFSAQVRLPGGAPAAGARLHLLARPIARVGLLTVGTASPAPVGGTVRRELQADAAGGVAAIDVPAAVYDLLVDPPPGSPLARTRFTVDLTAADQLLTPLALAPHVTLHGRVLSPATPAAPVRARVVAIERGAPAIFQAQTDPLGQFQMQVDPGALYDVLATPVVQTPPLARVRAQAQVGASDLALADLVAPAGRVVSGIIQDRAGNLLGGTLVEAFLGLCTDGLPAVGEAAAAADGSFTLAAPSPP